MDLKKLILTGMTVSEIEQLLSEKKKMLKPDACENSAIENWLLKNVLKYKNPQIK